MNFKNSLLAGSAIVSPMQRIVGGRPFGPQIVFEPEKGSGAGGTDEKTEQKPEETPVGDGDKSEQKPEEKEKQKPTDSEAKLLREVMEKKQKIDELQGSIETLSGRLKEFEGIDPKEVRELLKARADSEKSEAEKRGEFDRVKKMMADEHANEIATYKAQIDALKSDYEIRVKALEEKLVTAETVINDLTIGTAFDNSAFISEELVLTPSKARVIYGSHFDIKDGKVVSFDKPRGAENRTMLVDGSGSPLNFEEALKRFVQSDPERDKLLKSAMKTGAGSITDAHAGGKATSEEKITGIGRIQAALNAKVGKK